MEIGPRIQTRYGGVVRSAPRTDRVRPLIPCVYFLSFITPRHKSLKLLRFAFDSLIKSVETQI